MDLSSPRLPDATEILESMDEAFYALDRDWRFIYVNRGAERFWNTRREELVGRNILEAFPAFPGSEPHIAHQRAMASGERLRVETVSTVTNRPVELHLQPAPWGLAVYFRDISDRLRMESELRDREAILSLAERTAEIGVWDVDLQTNRLRGTAQFFRILGLPPTNEWISLDVTRSIRHPEDRDRVIDGFTKAVSAGEDDYESEYRIVRPDGEVRWIFGRGRVIRDGTGRPLRYAGVDIDVTQWKGGEEAAQRLGAIVAWSDAAIVSKDLNGIVQTWNNGAKRLFGYQPEEIIGRPITVIIPEDRQDEEIRILDRVRHGEAVEHYETVRRRRDGSLVEISLTVSPIRDGAGKIVGASKIAQDITERRRAENQQRLLLREMHHRIKNLFAVAVGLVSLSARSADSVQELAEAMRERLSALARAHDLTMPGVDLINGPSGRTTTLADLTRTILAPHVSLEHPQRIAIVGPEILIGGGALTSVALLINEFATNAAKYGALSASAGSIDIGWTTDADDIRFDWRERGGPAVAGQPTMEGFGTRLTEATVLRQLEGRITREWDEAGLTLRLVLPVSRLGE